MRGIGKTQHLVLLLLHIDKDPFHVIQSLGFIFQSLDFNLNLSDAFTIRIQHEINLF